MRLAPLLPARILAQVDSTPQPRGVTSPIPETTTRRNSMASYPCWLLANSLGEERYGITEGLNAFSSVVRNLHRELFFKGHHQLDLVERVSTQIVDKAGLFDNLLGIHIKVFHNDLADPISDIAHSLTSLFEIDVSFRFLLAHCQIFKHRIS